MTFRESFYQVKQMLVNRLNDFGLESANMNMGWTTMLSIEQNTRLTIDVPLNLVYSDAFLITGTLETSTYSRLNGKTVKLKVGNTVVDTTTTNINGEYSFTQTPVQTGNHSFQVIFEGTNIHAASQSSVINRTVGKETSVMNLDAVSTQHYGNTLITGGQLLDNDGQYVANASVVYKLDGTTVSTLTTDSYGTFSVTRTINSFTTTRMTFEYAGDSNYTNTNAYVDVDVYQPQLSLTSNKNILSYADNDNATITAQLIDNAPTPQNLAIADTEIIFTYPSTSTAYSDFSSIPVQYDSFELLFKSQGTTFYIYGDDEYPLRQIDIPNNNSSKFRLIWDKTKLSLYQDDEVLLNSITDYFDGEAVTSYTDSHVRFATLNNNTVDLTNIKIQNILSNTIDTDANGQAIFTYNSQGIGDITISANIDGSLVIEIYDTVEDCTDYQQMTNNSKESRWTIPSAVSSSSIFGYSSDGWKFGNASQYSTITYNGIDYPPFSLECIVTDSNGIQPIIGAMFGSSYIFADRYSNNQLRINVNGSTTIYNVSYSSVYTFRYELTDSAFSVYIDDVLIATVNHSLTGDCVPALQTGNNRYTVIKDFKLKPL